MGKKATIFACTECGTQSTKWLGRCPECNAWNSYAEETAPQETSGVPRMSVTSTPVAIDEVDADDAPRITTGLENFDRVLGGGLVPGSVILLGGEPGIGKSTLLLQAAEQLARHGVVLYVSGEESPRQIALRARRLRTTNHNIVLFPETSTDRVVEEIERSRPAVLIIDSIQTLHTTRSNSSPGSTGQVRDSAATIMAAAKRLSIPAFLIGHITKDGSIAGPKMLEHIVDTVLYFEGDRFQHGRLLRAYKNRFGPVNEVAIYQMHDDGLEEIANPSAALLSQRSDAAGSAIVAALEGSRSLLVEVQALVSPSHYPTPKRTAMGIDGNRLALLLAVVEKKSGISFVGHDVYVNVAGGLELDEPAVDLGVTAALISSLENRALPRDLAIFGEVGLLGEVRSVSQPDTRAAEARAYGFRRLLVPEGNAAQIRGAGVTGVRKIEDFAQRLFA